VSPLPARADDRQGKIVADDTLAGLPEGPRRAPFTADGQMGPAPSLEENLPQLTSA